MKIPDRGRWERLSPLLDELLGLDEGAQQRRLAALRVEEATLADELQGMLIESQRAGALRFLEDGAPRVEAEQGLAGMQIGAYVLESLLGEGGGGTVWKATRADGRYEGVVAVKLLHLSLIGSAGAQRFAREGAILARLTHPNIARLLDAGVTAAGQPYLVLEFVDGIAIDRHCDALRLSVEERLALFEDVLAGVAHAHNHLIIHRDIKPNNILVTADGMVKLLDFGIAKLLQDDGSATVDGQRALTPRYAAPEQLQNGPVTTATDVYSLGVLLYHLLVGRHPTAADTANPADILRATLDTDPAKMTSVLTRATETLDDDAQRLAADRATSVPRLRRQLEGDLETIVGVALRKDAAQRYQSVLAMSADVRRYLAHEPVSARPASWRYRCAKFVRRNRGSVAAGLLVALSVAAGVVGTVTQARRAEVLAFKAQHERDNALRQLSYAKATNEFVAFLLQEGSDKPFTTSDLLARAEPVLRMQFASDPSQRAHLLAEIASQYAQSTYLDKANELLVQARAAASESTDPALQGSIDCLFAFLKGIDGSFGLAEKTFEEALGKLHRDPDVDRALVGECLQFRAEVADIKGDRTAAYRYALEAVDTLAPLRAEDRSLSIVLHQTLANTQAAIGQSAAGAAEYRKAVAELEAMGRGSTRGASVMYQNLGAILARAGQTLAAIDAVEHALEISRGLGGPLPSLQSNHASYLAEIGHTREAGAMIDAALVEARARGDKRSAPFIAVQGAHAWCMAGGLARCGELLAMGRMELASIVPSGHPAFAALETTQAELDIARGDDSHARETLLKAVAICDAAGEKGGVRVRALELLARTELRLGDTAAAQTHADGAVAQARSMAGGFEHSQLLGSSRLVQGLVAEALGRHDAARASWSEAAANLVATVGASAPQTLEAKRLLGS